MLLELLGAPLALGDNWLLTQGPILLPYQKFSVDSMRARCGKVCGGHIEYARAPDWRVHPKGSVSVSFTHAVPMWRRNKNSSSVCCLR